LWGENGKGFKNLLEDFKTINRKRKISSYKNPIFRFNTKNEFIKNMSESMNLMQGSNLIREMSLVYLVAVFENFLQKTLAFSFRKKHDALKTCQKNLSYEEILKFDDIDAIKEAVIEKEIMIVNEDIEVVREYIKKKFGIDISKINDEYTKEIEDYTKRSLKLGSFEPVNWNNFKERFYRRNIIIHNLGMPNKLYKQKTGYQGKNEALEVSMEYLLESINIFCQIGMNIGLAFEDKMEK
jgi:hypothetical protein